jgi:hypothetical protein
VSDPRTEWLITPEAYMEFFRGLSKAERLLVNPFFKKINATVLKANEAAAIRAKPTYNLMRNMMERFAGRAHSQDIIHASYAYAEGRPILADTKFASFVRDTVRGGGRAQSVYAFVWSLEDIKRLLASY